MNSWGTSPEFYPVSLDILRVICFEHHILCRDSLGSRNTRIYLMGTSLVIYQLPKARLHSCFLNIIQQNSMQELDSPEDVIATKIVVSCGV